MGEKHTREELDNGYRYHIVRDGVQRIVVEGHELRDGDIVEDVEVPDTREKLEADIAEFFDENGNTYDDILDWLDRQAAITRAEDERICDTCEWPNLAAQPDREAYDRIADLTAENERLRDVARKQAESFKGIEVELAAANSTCNTLRASVAGLKGTVERQRDELAEAHGLLKELYDLAATGEFEFDDMYRFSRILGRLGIEVS